MEGLNAARQEAIRKNLPEKIGEENFIRNLLQLPPQDLPGVGRHHEFEMLFPDHVSRAIRKNAALPETFLSKRDSLLPAGLNDHVWPAFEQLYVRRRQSPLLPGTRQWDSGPDRQAVQAIGF